jgi:hypothetical protein
LQDRSRLTRAQVKKPVWEILGVEQHAINLVIQAFLKNRGGIGGVEHTRLLRNTFQQSRPQCFGHGEFHCSSTFAATFIAG